MLLKSNPVLYEIYPRSFQDTNGDGFGDLQGIITRLPYLKDLGISTIWLTPFFPSPMKDGGYDISNYYDIAPETGTLEDFRQMVSKAHKLDLQIVIDLVLNHTSDQHSWFIQARSSLNNPKRDWYIWKDPIEGKAPNNWKSVFEPSVWEFDTKTGQYYYHSFLKEQPDLNWKNPLVRQAFKDICAFWIDLGVDGFRLDAVNYLWKDQRFLDEPANNHFKSDKEAPFYALEHIYMKDQDGIFPFINEIGDFVHQYGNAFIILEAYPNVHGIKAIPIYQKYYRSNSGHISLPFNMELITLPWNASAYREFIIEFLRILKPYDIPLFVLGNHDRSRVATRIGRDQARTAAVLTLTLPGMPVIYYGEELGMEDVRPIPTEMIHDTKELRSPGFGRDPERTPMQWDSSNKAGFTLAEPWLPLEKEFKIRNVASQKIDPKSIFTLYKNLLSIRSDKNAVLTKGDFQSWDTGCTDVFAYTRTYKNKTLLILLNFSGNNQICRLPNEKMKQILSSFANNRTQKLSQTITLLPNEAIILV